MKGSKEPKLNKIDEQEPPEKDKKPKPSEKPQRERYGFSYSIGEFTRDGYERTWA